MTCIAIIKPPSIIAMLNAILKRSNNKTLVIGDEVCRGTEHISGNSIVATTLLFLSKVESSFIFATHLHELMELEEIIESKVVKAFHLSVEYDEKTNSIIYDRKLKEGSGEKVYGIVVAQGIIHDKEFINQAISIKNRLLNKYSGKMSDKISNYNSDKYVYKCEICGCDDKKDFSKFY